MRQRVPQISIDNDPPTSSAPPQTPSWKNPFSDPAFSVYIFPASPDLQIFTEVRQRNDDAFGHDERATVGESARSARGTNLRSKKRLIVLLQFEGKEGKLSQHI